MNDYEKERETLLREYINVLQKLEKAQRSIEEKKMILEILEVDFGITLSEEQKRRAINKARIQIAERKLEAKKKEKAKAASKDKAKIK